MSVDLSNLFILVTRPEKAGISLCNTLQKHGAKTWHYPTLSFVSLTHTENFQQMIRAIEQQDWLIFVSPKAVDETLFVFESHKNFLKNHVKIAALGEGTARRLHENQFENILYPTQNQTSEGLLLLLKNEEIFNKNILLIKGKNGRDLLQSELQKRGAHVNSLDAYERVLNRNLPNLQSLLEKNIIDSIVCTSFFLMSALKKIAGSGNWIDLKKIPLVVISQRLKALAEDLGFQTIWVAQNASDAALLQLFAEKKDELCQRKKITL